MMELLLEAVLNDGIAELTANPDLLERLFRTAHPMLGDAEVAQIRNCFLEKPPEVGLNYARQDAKFPLFLIILGSDAETDKFTGEGGLAVESEEFEEADPDEGADLVTRLESHAYTVIVYAPHPRVAVWYYHLAKILFRRARKTLYEHVREVDLSGSDLEPDGRYAPNGLYRRQVNVALKLDSQTIADKEPRATKIAGLYVPPYEGDLTSGIVINTSGDGSGT